MCVGGAWRLILSLADAEAAENAIEQVIGVDSADHGAQLFQGAADFEGWRLPKWQTSPRPLVGLSLGASMPASSPCNVVVPLKL